MQNRFLYVVALIISFAIATLWSFIQGFERMFCIKYLCKYDFWFFSFLLSAVSCFAISVWYVVNLDFFFSDYWSVATGVSKHVLLFEVSCSFAQITNRLIVWQQLNAFGFIIEVKTKTTFLKAIIRMEMGMNVLVMFTFITQCGWKWNVVGAMSRSCRRGSRGECWRRIKSERYRRLRIPSYSWPPHKPCLWRPLHWKCQGFPPFYGAPACKYINK